MNVQQDDQNQTIERKESGPGSYWPA